MPTTCNAPTTRHTLRNQWGWVLVYTATECGPDWDEVTVVKTFRGEPAGEMTLTRDEARAHWAAQVRAGFSSRKDF